MFTHSPGLRSIFESGTVARVTHPLTADFGAPRPRASLPGALPRRGDTDGMPPCVLSARGYGPRRAPAASPGPTGRPGNSETHEHPRPDRSTARFSRPARPRHHGSRYRARRSPHVLRQPQRQRQQLGHVHPSSLPDPPEGRGQRRAGRHRLDHERHVLRAFCGVERADHQALRPPRSPHNLHRSSRSPSGDPPGEGVERHQRSRRLLHLHQKPRGQGQQRSPHSGRS